MIIRQSGRRNRNAEYPKLNVNSFTGELPQIVLDPPIF